MTRLIRWAAVCLLATAAHASTTISGNVRDLSTAAVPSRTVVRFCLKNNQGNVVRVSGSGVLSALCAPDFKPNGSGVISGTLYANSELTPSGTWYEMAIITDGVTVYKASYTVSGAAFDISTATPLASTPVVPVTPTQVLRSYIHTQSPAGTTWTINHNFNDINTPCDFFDSSNQRIFPDTVVQTNANTVTATFTSAQAGKAICWNTSSITLLAGIQSVLVPNPTANQSVTGGFDFSINGNFDASRVCEATGSRVMDARCFAGANAGVKIQAAHDDLPSTGGVIDARGLEGAQTVSSVINVTKPVTLLLGAATFSLSSSSFLNITAPANVVGVGWSDSGGVGGTIISVGAGVSATTDIITVAPTAILDGLQLKDFQIVPVSGTPARYGIHFDGTNNQIYNVVVDHVKIKQLGSAAIRGSGSGGAQGTPFMSRIQFSELHGGISLPNAGDTVLISNNQITGTGICVDASFQAGATTFIVEKNNLTCDGGMIHFGTAVVAPRIVANELETFATFTGSNGALVDLDGTSGSHIVGVVLEANSFQVVNGITANAVRLNYADNSTIVNNRFQRGATTSKDVVITANASTNWVGPNYWEGTFTPENMFNDAGTGSMLTAPLSNSGVHGLVLNNNRPLRYLNPTGTAMRTVVNYDASERTNVLGFQERSMLLGDNGSTSIYDGTAPGVIGLQLVTNKNIVNSAASLAWGSSGVATPDTGLSRTGAGVVSVGNGTAGDTTGTLGATAMNTARFRVVGSAPSCSFATGGGTSPSCSLETGSTDLSGTAIVTTGTGAPGTSGTVTLTFETAFGANPHTCVWTPALTGAGAWNARATTMVSVSSTSLSTVTWDNNSVALTVSTAYHLNYICFAK